MKAAFLRGGRSFFLKIALIPLGGFPLSGMFYLKNISIPIWWTNIFYYFCLKITVIYLYNGKYSTNQIPSIRMS